MSKRRPYPKPSADDEGSSPEQTGSLEAESEQYDPLDAENYSRSHPPAPTREPIRLTVPPEWCALLLDELFRQAIKDSRCNVQLACDIAGVTKQSAYEYRDGANGEWFRRAWDLIVLDAQYLREKNR